MMYHNNQMLTSKTLCFHTLVFSFIFAKMYLSHIFFIPFYMFEIYHIMIFNVTCELKSITYI
jgi:hypothetical protein